MDEPLSPEEARRRMLDLPSDWWQTAQATYSLLQWFKLHIVGLLLAGSVDHQFQYSFYTGFLLEHTNRLLWLSAGHVVEEIESALSSDRFRVSQFCWLDNYEDPKAPAVPVHRRDMPMHSWKQSSLDLGVVLPSLLDTGNLLRNEKLQLMEERVWRNLAQANPEGFYAIGYPRPWTTHTQKQVSPTQALHSLRADLACLPLAETTSPAPPPDDRWLDTAAFYGKILPFPDMPDFEVDDIKGMSGGPVLSVERNKDGRIVYRLVGIVQSWYPSQGIVRAEPIARVAETIEAWLP